MSEILDGDQLEFELNTFILINNLKFDSYSFKVSYDRSHESMMITVIKGDKSEQN